MAMIAPGAHVVGDVSFGKGCSVWYNAVLRADMAPIRVGDDTNVQDNAVIHVDAGLPCVLGAGVTVGHGAIVHGATVGDNTIIGMGAVVLNGAHVGKDCIVAAGAVVTEGREVPDGTVAAGCPARHMRDMTAADVEANRHNARHYVELAERQTDDWRQV